MGDEDQMPRQGLPIVSIVSLGNMGGWIAEVLIRNGVIVRSVLEGRSEASRIRATSIGVVQMRDYVSLVDGADLLLSCVPPSEAVEVAETLAEALQVAHRKPIYVDLNAISRATVLKVNNAVRGSNAVLVDGCIIGATTKSSKAPRFYVSGPKAEQVEILGQYGLNIRSIGPEIGSASALKCCFAGLSKGFTALAVEMILAARSAGVDEQLLAEIRNNAPQFLALINQLLPDSYAKAPRWVGEMQEIAVQYEDIPGGRDTYSGISTLFGAMREANQAEVPSPDQSIIPQIRKFLSMT